MNKIIILPDGLARKIAAGEVIERPVSALKELVENALDAGATEITVELGEGGKALILVRDNGCGMSREDAQSCFARHATSKIACEDDLSAIATLGFRGEALASISAVSRLILKTSEGGEGAGICIEREGDRVSAVRDIAFPRGTTVEVRDLFFNLPARRKFLQSDASELGHCAKYLTQVALAYPRLRLAARQGARTILECPPAETLGARIFHLYGKALLETLMELEYTEAGTRVSGFVSRPPAGRADRSRQHFFVNSRPVKDKVLSSALTQAFRGLLEKDRWPEAFLFLTVPAGEVDVNVHPQKSEVRFRSSGAVFQAVLRAVERSRARAGGIKAVAAEPQSDGTAPLPPVEYIPGEAGDAAGFPFRVAEPALTGAEGGGFPGSTAESETGPVVLGQLDNAYIVAADGDGILVVDQHNAHERVLFERYSEIDRKRGWPVTISLIPLVFDLPPGQAAVLEADRELLEGTGFRVEPMGGRSFALREYPDIFKPEEALAAFLGFLEESASGGAEDKKSRMLATLACRTAVKAGEPLLREKMAFLVRELFKTANPAVCPHGRPIVVRLSKKKIEKGLGRR